MKDTTRVKHRTISQKRRSARFAFAETPERAVNKGLYSLSVTANAPHIAPLILSSKPMAENCRLSPSVWEKPARLGGLFAPLLQTLGVGQ